MLTTCYAELTLIDIFQKVDVEQLNNSSMEWQNSKCDDIGLFNKDYITIHIQSSLQTQKVNK